MFFQLLLGICFISRLLALATEQNVAINKVAEKGCGKEEFSQVISCFDGQYQKSNDDETHQKCYKKGKCDIPINKNVKYNNRGSMKMSEGGKNDSVYTLQMECSKSANEEARKNLQLCVQKQIPSFQLDVPFEPKNYLFNQLPIRQKTTKINSTTGNCQYPRVKQCFRKVERDACKIFDACVEKTFKSCNIEFTKATVCSCARSVYQDNRTYYTEKYMKCIQKVDPITEPVVLNRNKKHIQGFLSSQPAHYCGGHPGPCKGFGGGSKKDAQKHPEKKLQEIEKVQHNVAVTSPSKLITKVLHHSF